MWKIADKNELGGRAAATKGAKMRPQMLSLMAVGLVLLFLVGCGSTAPIPAAEVPAATSVPEQAAVPTSESTPEPPTATFTPPTPEPITLLTLLPFNYRENSVGDGWKIGMGEFYFNNESDVPLHSQEWWITNAVVETAEGKTYPADIIQTSWYDLEGHFAKGEYKWDAHKIIKLGGQLPIPSKFPFQVMSGDYYNGFGFRFAEAAHPTKLILQFAQGGGEFTIDLQKAVQAISDPSPSEVKARPLSEFASKSVIDNSQYKFSWDGTCVVTTELMDNGAFLSYTLTNKDQFNEQAVSFNFVYLLYRPGGLMEEPSDEKNVMSVGPGQTIQGLERLVMFVVGSDAPPLYLIS